MMQRLWLIGGTQESRQLLTAIGKRWPQMAAAQNAEILVSVTTATAQQLYPDLPGVRLWVGKLGAEAALDFVVDHHITAILDASHPFATAISQQAIAIAAQQRLPYLRFERPSLPPPADSWRDRFGRPGWVSLEKLDEAVCATYLPQERTLLTLGYRLLSQFRPWQDQAQLYARILPSLVALEAALGAGFTADRLIALRPPISAELETALWRQWQITQVITKASGAAGGEATKQAIAAQLGIRLLVLQRPPLTYPQQTPDLETAVHFALNALTECS